jgi:GAF domain-containing protein/HAMP domain-containing protein
VNLEPNQRPSVKTRLETINVSWLWISGIAILLFTISELFAVVIGGNGQLWPVLPVFIAAPVVYWLARRDRHIVGAVVMMTAIGIQSLLAPLAQSGLGAPIALTSLTLIIAIGLTTLPRKYIGRVLVGALVVSIVSVLIDLFGSPNRPVAELIGGRWVFSLVALSVLGVYFSREFLSLDVRTKIVLGILVSVGVSLGALSFFAIDRTSNIADTLSRRLETSVRLLAEEQLVNTVFTESDRANQFFEQIEKEVSSLAEYRASLQTQQETLRQGTYWNADTNLVQLEGGQYGNSVDNISSVFVPVNTDLNESVLAELNISAYLDFSTPRLLETNPDILAIYYIDPQGVVRYYPNIGLASLLPPDFDATTRPYYEITSPLFNPQRSTRWTIPYVDATGGGLVVTAASPVYFGNTFSGVVAADIQLAQITEQVSSIKVGQTGYAFMVDDAGRIISMPPAGYEMLEIDPNALPADEFFKQTVLGQGPADLSAITARMVAGGNGLNVVNVNGADTYISYSQLRSNGYSIALVVPVSEMQGAIEIARNETQQQTQSAVRTAAIILFTLLLGTVIVSLSLGQIIAAPVRRLTEVAGQITGGDLTVQAPSITRDEIGTLAHAFNAMTSRLRETLDGLEQNVQERTAELVEANERNENRAKQFESIAQVTRTIGSTRDLDSLLSQLTVVISREFGFYHVGVFLTDSGKEYAILSAANSEGGQVMLARGHRLKVGEVGLVGYVTGTGKPRVALDTGKDAVFFNNPDLPNTHSEITLPLSIGEDVIGALDVQSTEPNAFSQEDINILSILADQVGIAIQNARQFEETRKALREADLLSRQFVQTKWQEFTKSQKLMGVHHSGTKVSLLYTKSGKGNGQNPLSTGQLKARERGARLSLPLKLHGEVIGSVDVRSPENRQWDQDELEIITAIIERAALSMENARLLAESQRLAAKERTIGDISAKISAQSNVDELLKTAVQELGRTLPGMDIAIQFKKEETE